MKTILHLYHQAKAQLDETDYDVAQFLELESLPAIAQAKLIPEKELDAKLDSLESQIEREIKKLKGDEAANTKKPEESKATADTPAGN